MFGVTNLCEKQQREIVDCLIAAHTIEEDEDRETPNDYKKRKKNERETQWKQKQLHGQFIRQTIDKASEVGGDVKEKGA